MKMIRRLLASVLVAVVAAAGGGAAFAAPQQESGLIVKLRSDGNGDAPDRAQARLERLASRQGVQMMRGLSRVIGERVHVVQARGDAAAMAKRLAADPDVVYAVPDRRVRVTAVPNDPLFPAGNGANGPAAGQWYLKTPDATLVSAIDAQAAWDITQGSESVVVAVLDTGVRRNHPDLAGKLLPGYDFITKVAIANDGNGRDSDPSDPGDWVSQADITNGTVDADCELSDSSWHGTQVSGIIGALTNNGAGIASVGWNVRVLPVRVIGKCSGFQSDIVAAMRWAAGIAVAGVPANPNPAKVLNLSLGSDGACDAAYADAVAAVRAVGVVVVASAGNGSGHAVGSPANCAGVIGVGGLRHAGTKVGYSDLGPEVSISAPAGNCVNDSGECLYPIMTTTDVGTTAPAGATYTDGFNNPTLGTSFSSPLVAATAALMLSVRPTLTPDELRSLLMTSARAFPTPAAGSTVPQCRAPDTTAQDECNCTTATCGAGMLDAGAAVLHAAGGVLARIAVTPASPRAGTIITLDAGGTMVTDGRTIATVQWSLVDGGGIVTGFSGAVDTITTTLSPTAAGSITVSVTVTDSVGNSATTQQTITVAAASTSSGGGGGGALGLGWLAALALATLAAAAASRPRPLKRRIDPR